MASQISYRGRAKRVSERDREIYRQARCGRKQSELAVEFGLSQCRISAIVARLERLGTVETLVGADALRQERLTATLELYESRLEYLFDQAVEAWEDSRQPQWTVREKWVNGQRTEEQQTLQSPQGDPGHLKNAMQAAAQLAMLRRRTPHQRESEGIVEAYPGISRAFPGIGRASAGNQEGIKRE